MNVVKQNKIWFCWDEQKGAEALAFYKSITEAVGKPLVLWQIPVGNMSLDDTFSRFRDDEVPEYRRPAAALTSGAKATS
jgi:hypothetical protein